MKPSVGRIVHYVSDSQCRAAIVINVRGDDAIDLFVWNPRFNHHTLVNDVFWPAEDVRQDELGIVNGTWHWPERVE